MFGNLQIDIAAMIGGIGVVIGGIVKLLQERRENRRYNDDIISKLDTLTKTAEHNRSGIGTIQEEVTVAKDGVKHIHRYRLYHDMSRAVIVGHTTMEELRELSKLFESYKTLGGNGEIETLYRRYIELPIKENEHD